jgi:uncharacterized membrane protein YtjA (UPF0391 family)
MLRLALLFLVLSVVAGVFGYAEFAGDVAPVARISLLVFLALFVVCAAAFSFRTAIRD